MAKELFLGLDGGGTKTTAVVFDKSGSFVCRFVGESINYYSIGMEKARENMLGIIDGLFPICGTRSFKGAVIGMSALGDRASEKELEAFSGGIINADNIIMDSDLYIALEALNAPGECAVVISGTGSMAAARTADEKIIHAGGFGHILGDEGSGYAIALSGIKAAIAAAEGYGEETALLYDCLKFFNIPDIYALIDLFYEKGVSRKDTAAFAGPVRRRAADGDNIAKGIMLNAAAELAGTALAVIKKLSPDSPVGLWGGIFQHSSLFAEAFCAELAKNGYCNAALLDFPPETGAVLAAMRAAGLNPGEAELANIRKTYIETNI